MKKIISGLMISTVVLGFGISASAVDGVSEVTADGNNKQVNSDATIKVLEGDKTPTKPEDKNEPDGETGDLGPLSLDQVIVFAFEDMKLSGTTQSIPLVAKGAQNVQVTDTRGTGAGWNLQIKQTPLVDTTDSTKVLKGSYITLKNAEIKAGTDNVESDKAPVADNYESTAANKGDFQKIITAQADNGMGTWRSFYNQTDTNDIKLVVPSGNLKGDYKGSVVWALSDGPAVNPAVETEE